MNVLGNLSRFYTILDEPKLSPNSHSHNTLFNHFFNQKKYYRNEDLILSNLKYFYEIFIRSDTFSSF